MYTVLEGGRIANDAGEIAVRYKQEIPKYIKIGQREYVFAVQSHVSLAWVHPDDVDRMLAQYKVCCGGNQSKVCTLADETHVKRWLGISVW